MNTPLVLEELARQAQLHLSFERFADNLAQGREPASASDTEHSLLIEEVKVGCSFAMLHASTDHIGLRSCSARSWSCRDLKLQKF